MRALRDKPKKDLRHTGKKIYAPDNFWLKGQTDKQMIDRQDRHI